MKRVLCIMAVIVCCIVVSCKTTGEYQDQTEIDSAFSTVYKNYENALIMDGAVSYIVVKGDTLSKITGSYYGQANQYFFPLIMLASHEATVSDPDLIEPGMKLTIPDLKKNLDNPGSRGKIKSFLGDIAVVYDRKAKPAAAKRLRDLAATL